MSDRDHSISIIIFTNAKVKIFVNTNRSIIFLHYVIFHNMSKSVDPRRKQVLYLVKLISNLYPRIDAINNFNIKLAGP